MNDDEEDAHFVEGMMREVMSGAIQARTVWYLLMDIHNPNPEPYAVVRADTSQREDAGCAGTIVSLHMLKEEAERIVHEFNEGPLS